MGGTTINKEEVARFGAIAKEWWDEEGKFKPLHKLNPLRLAYIRQHILDNFSLDTKNVKIFKGLDIVDIGCGGGLLCEPMARLGANIVGIDAAKRNIEIAKIHAKEVGLKINYRAMSVEELAKGNKQFDIVLNMEVVEHVNNVPLYLKYCAKLVKPKGLMFISTINRTAKSFALAIIGAEYILNWLPKGTHSYDKFITPEEISKMIERENMRIIDRSGVSYSLLNDEWHLSRDMAVNYMIAAKKTV